MVVTYVEPEKLPVVQSRELDQFSGGQARGTEGGVLVLGADAASFIERFLLEADVAPTTKETCRKACASSSAQALARHTDINTTLLYSHVMNGISNAPEHLIDAFLKEE